MYTQDDISKLINEKIKIFKDAQNNKTSVPKYTDVYKDSVDFYEQICVHSEIGKFPEKLFKNRAPNQSQQEFDYMKGSYKTTTYPIWTRFLGTLNRMWNDQNWSKKWGNSDKTIEGKKYVETEYPIYGSLDTFYKSIVTKDRIKDANAIICHKPYELPTKLNEDGELVIDESPLIDPIAIIYYSPQIIDFEDEEYALIELCEKSMVQFGNSQIKAGKIFEFYDEQNIWKIIQIGKQIDYQFDILLYWNHNLGYLPVKKMGGEPIQKDDDVLYQSKFMSAIGCMDLILLDSSYLQAAKTGHAFPHKWEFVDECDYNNGRGACIEGLIMNEDGKPIACPQCNGTGKRNRNSPLGITQIKAGTKYDDPGNKLSPPFFGWEAPDPTILNFLRSEIDKNEQIALSVLNLNVSNSDVKGSDTALGKKIDREEMMSAIQGESDDIFARFEFSHKCILQMRHGSEIELPSISYPKNFSILSGSDLTDEIGVAKEKGLPDIALRELLIEFMSTRFNEEQVKWSFKLAIITDRLLTLSPLEISQKKLSGSVANWEDILHTSIYAFIDELSLELSFKDLDVLAQRKMLIDLAKAKDEEISPKKMNTDAILAGANGGG